MEKYYVYILESETTGKLYIGQTNNPEKRLLDHNRGASTYTKNKGHWRRIYLKEFESRTESILLEKTLKSWKSPERIRSMIKRECVG